MCGYKRRAVWWIGFDTIFNFFFFLYFDSLQNYFYKVIVVALHKFILNNVSFSGTNLGIISIFSESCVFKILRNFCCFSRGNFCCFVITITSVSVRFFYRANVWNYE